MKLTLSNRQALMLKQGFRGLKNWTTCEQSFIFFPDFTRVLANGDGVNTGLWC
jgi:hypothetical protein